MTGKPSVPLGNHDVETTCTSRKPSLCDCLCINCIIFFLFLRYFINAVQYLLISGLPLQVIFFFILYISKRYAYCKVLHILLCKGLKWQLRRLEPLIKLSTYLLFLSNIIIYNEHCGSNNEFPWSLSVRYQRYMLTGFLRLTKS
jgi:hypothetical protein